MENSLHPLSCKLLRLATVITILTTFAFSARSIAERRGLDEQTLAISPTALPHGTASVVYKAQLRAEGGSGRYHFSRVNGKWPRGLSLGSNGVIRGTPQSAGSFSARVLVTDSQGGRGEATLSLHIADKTEGSGTPISVSISPLGPTVISGSTQQFAAVVTNSDDTAVAWSSSQGTISTAGLFTAPSVTATTNVLVRATSMADSTKSAATSVIITPASPDPSITMSISPTSANLASGATQQFSATISNTSTTAVTWSASKGTISPSGLFTAPNVTTTTTVSVTATSVADPSKSAQASVSVHLPTAVSVSITPTSASLVPGGTQQFSAQVSNSSNTSVTWSASTGTISPSGLFTAPTATATTSVTVTATSVADSTQIANALVTVNVAPPPTGAGGGGGGGPDNLYCGPGNVPSFGASDGPAQLPQTCLYTARAGTPSPGAVTLLPSGADLNAALNAAHCGDTIQLQAGGTFTSFNNLPAKKCDDNHWITIETSGIASLPPEGTRITPCYSGVLSLPGRPAFPCSNPLNVMAKLLITCQGGCELNFSADHYRFIGLEITRQTGFGILYTMSDLGNSNKIIFDQTWWHGDDISQFGDETDNGIFLDLANNVAVIDSYFNDFYCIANIGVCTDAKTIGGGIGDPKGNPWQTFKIVNNFLEAAGENFLEGGDFGTASPFDYEIRRNHFFKPLTWYHGSPSFSASHGQPPVVKNLFELKNGRRILIEGNLFENSWGGFTQDGGAILLTPINQNFIPTQGICPNCEVSDITIRYNVIRHTGQMFAFANAQYCNAATPCLPAGGHNYSIHDDLAYHLHDSLTCNDGACTPWIIEIISDPKAPLASQSIHDLTINHITQVLDSPSGVNAGFNGGPSNPSTEMSNFTWKNSIIAAGQFGWSNGGPPDNTWCAFNAPSSTPVIPPCWIGTVLFGNNMIPWGAVNGGTWSLLGGGGSLMLLNDQNSVQYVNLAGDDYHLQASSPGHNQADDGKDVGADIDAVNTHTRGVQ